MRLNFVKESEDYYRIDNINRNGDIIGFHVGSIRLIPGNFTPGGSFSPEPMWKVYAGRIQTRYPAGGMFKTASKAIGWVKKYAIGVMSLAGVNAAILEELPKDPLPTDGGSLRTSTPFS